MLQYLLKISTDVFCHCCPRREGVRRGAVLSSRCLASWPSPSTTVDRKRTSKRRHHVWSVERFALSFSFSFSRSVHGCMGMDVWVNVFTMPFLCVDPGPWRRMGRAWPATSAKTTSATTCHQDSAWRVAESRQDRVIVEVVRKAIVVGKCCSMCRTHLQMFSVSTVLGEKASDVVHSRRASAELPDRRPTPHWTEEDNWTKASCFVFEECAWVYGNGCVSECLYHAVLVRRS